MTSVYHFVPKLKEFWFLSDLLGISHAAQHTKAHGQGDNNGRTEPEVTGYWLGLQTDTPINNAKINCSKARKAWQDFGLGSRLVAAFQDNNVANSYARSDFTMLNPISSYFWLPCIAHLRVSGICIDTYSSASRPSSIIDPHI